MKTRSVSVAWSKTPPYQGQDRRLKFRTDRQTPITQELARTLKRKWEFSGHLYKSLGDKKMDVGIILQMDDKSGEYIS